jgi:hypothetical protein
MLTSSLFSRAVNGVVREYIPVQSAQKGCGPLNSPTFEHSHPVDVHGSTQQRIQSEQHGKPQHRANSKAVCLNSSHVVHSLY